METYQELLCSPSLASGLQQQSIYLALVNVILSLTAILGNFLILVALRKESSLHLPSKLLYRCLAITDLLVGLVSQPLHAVYWISIANEHWNLCRYTRDATYVTIYAFCGVSLGTMTAITIDRLLSCSTNELMKNWESKNQPCPLGIKPCPYRYQKCQMMIIKKTCTYRQNKTLTLMSRFTFLVK